jgi:hypothetical protein
LARNPSPEGSGDDYRSFRHHDRSRLRTNVGTVSTLDDAVATFKSAERRSGKPVIGVRL